jgi:hypothetical protein
MTTPPASSRTSSGVSARRTSVTRANADTISAIGPTAWCAPRSSLQALRIDSESLPTGIAMPSAGQSSIATAFTVSKRAASSPG